MDDASYSALVDALAVPVILVGPNDRIRAANRAADAILSVQAVGQNYITVLRQPAVIRAITEVRHTQTPTTAQFNGRDGAKEVLYKVTVAPADQDVVLTLLDQTAEHDIGQMRRDFVANVSHELRTPLTALLGFIETLGGAARDDATARDRFLAIMAHEANRMTRLVDDLLSLSRVEEDERVRPRDALVLDHLLQDVIESLEPVSAEAGVNVTLSIAAPGHHVLGDAGQLAQVFTNLIENGLKYGAAGGVVDVEVAAPHYNQRLRADAICVSVSDKGEGIAPHHIARLTERFYRVDNHRSREVGGTGLGLAIVKHIINRHRGRLSIESEEGEGTKISVFLPTS